MKSYIIIVILLALFFLLYKPSNSSLENKLFILDVGQGDSALITTSKGQTLMIDTGPDSAVIRETSKLLPLGSTIDVVLITHPDVDHIGGLLPLLESFHVSQILLNPDSLRYVRENIPLHILEKTRISIVTPASRIHLSDGISMDVLWPYLSLTSSDDNTDSVVSSVMSATNRYLFMADVPQSVEHRILPLINDTLPLKVLKAGHHGSKYSSSWYFVESLEPGRVVFSSGAQNPHGHPSPQVLETIKRSGAEFDRTDNQGTVEYLLE